MKLLFLVLVLAGSAAAQTAKVPDPVEAITKDGRTVLLKADGTWVAKTDVPVQPLGVTAAGFAALKHGMSYEEVTSILGQEGEKLRETGKGTKKTIVYKWTADKAPRRANMTIEFLNGKLVGRFQVGLK
jgi:hypothetical protein